MTKLIILTLYLFSAAMWGIFVSRTTIINILISLELLLLAVSLYFIIFAVYLNDVAGIAFALYILTVAGAESAVGLAILLNFYRIRGDIEIYRYQVRG